MTLRERLPAWLGGKPPAPRAATDPIAFGPMFSETFGPGIGNQPTHANCLKANVGIADTATRAIANRVSSLNPLVKVSRRDRQKGTLVDEILDDHPLKSLLDRPHPDFSRSMLLRLTAQWIVTVGEAYWLKVGSRLSVPIELHPIPPTNIYPVLSGGVVDGYMVTDGQSKQRPLDRDKVVRFYFPDPENFHGAEGYLGPNATAVDSYAFAGQHLRSHYEHDATPKHVMKALEGATAFTEAEKQAFYTMWRQHFHSRVGTKRGLPAVLPTFYDLITIAVQSGADIVPLLEHWRDDQLMGMGVPRSVLGQVVSGDRSSAETNQYVFDLHAIFPIANLIAEGITLQLAPDFDPALFCEFEEFVSEDKRFILEQEQSDLVNKVRSPQQVLRDRNSDPEDAPWGEFPVGQLGQIPYTGDDIYTPGPDDAGALGGDEPEPEPPEDEEERAAQSRPSVGVSARSFFDPDVEWQRQLAREKAYVPSFLRAMQSVFKDQRESVLKKLEATVPRARVTAPDLFQPDEWAGLFEKRVEPIRVKAFEKILAESLGGLGVDEFVFTDEMRFLLKQQGALLVKHANATTQRMIADQLAKGAVEGEGIDQLATRIRGVFRTRRHHARTIARTEVLKASQEAQLASFEVADVPGQQWNISRDAAVRDSHAYADGQQRPRGQTFDLAGEPALAPGIGSGHGQLSAGNSINCRCFLTPVLEV
jgi:SPP1 gp7 family putative phage head morphogenesis protein